MASSCLFHSFFNCFDFEDFVSRRTQQNTFVWLCFDATATIDSIAELESAEDASKLTESLQDNCLGDDEEPEETDEFIHAFTEAEANFREEKFDKALALYGKAQKSLPLIAKTYLKLSVTFGKVDHNQQAVACAIAAFMLSPHDFESESMFAMAYSKMGYIDIGNKFIGENPQCEEASFVKAVIRGLPNGTRRRFDDEDLNLILQQLVNCTEAKDKATLRLVFLLYHIRYHHWLRPNSKLKIAQSLIRFLAENELIAKLCASAVEDFKATKHAALCALFSLFCLLAQICDDDESIAAKLWSIPAVRLFLSKIGIQITRDSVIISIVNHMGIFGRAVVVAYIDLISSLVKHANVRSQMCKVQPFSEVLWYGLTQVVYFRIGNSEFFHHHSNVEHKLPVLCLACTDGKMPKRPASVIEALNEFFNSSAPPFEFVGKFFAVFPLLVEHGEIMTSLEMFTPLSLEYTAHVFAVLSAIGFYAELDDVRLTKNCAMLTPFWLKMTSVKRIAKACGPDVWFFFARKLDFYSTDNEVFKDFKTDLSQTLDVLINLAGVEDFSEIEHIERGFPLLADALCIFMNCKNAPKSTSSTFVNEISCKALMLLNLLCANSSLFLKTLTICEKFGLSHVVLLATPLPQQREPSSVCLQGLKLLATLLKKSSTLPMNLIKFNEISTNLIVELTHFMATKTRNFDFILSACLCLTPIATAGRKCRYLMASSLKSCSAKPEVFISKLVNLMDSTLGAGSGDAKKLHPKDRQAVGLAIASFLAALTEVDSTFRTTVASEPKLHNALIRLRSCMSNA